MEKQNHLNACGTFEEINYAVAKTITELEKTNQELPYLLNYYKKNYNLVDTKTDLCKRYNKENNLPKEFDNILRKAILDD